MKNTILFTFALLMAFSTSMVAQNVPMDFETGGIGADLTWRTAENGTNPAMEFVTNPSVLAPNTSATVAKFTALSGANAWALVVCDDFGTFTFDAINSEVKVMVYKTVISNVGLKFEGTSGNTEIQIANTKINEWEEMTFDFSSEIGKTFNVLVLIPDFAPRTEDHIVYWDNLTFGTEVIVPGSDVSLSDLTVDGTTIDDFTSTKSSYAVELADGTTVAPTVAATSNDPLATVAITQATTLPGDATVLITAQDNSTETYTIAFTVAAPVGDNTDCSGTSTESQQGSFGAAGYSYAFVTSGTDVLVSFEMLDAVGGVNAYLWNTTDGFSETAMTVTGTKATITLSGQAEGTILTLACKFVWEAGGFGVTKYFDYTVGDDCSGVATEVTYTLLNAALTNATSNAASVEVSTDGTDVATFSQWVTQADLTIYETAIGVAQVVADDVNATQQEVDDATTVLETATTTFNAEKASGTMVLPIITDGTFDDGANTWLLYSGNGGTVDFSHFDAACSPVAAGAGTEWQLQLYQEGLILGNTKSYKITFDAAAAADRVITLSLEEASTSAGQGQYSLLGTTTDATARAGESKWDIPLTTSTASYELNVTMAYDETGSNPKFAFLLAETGEEVHIDNVSIVESMGTPTAVAQSKAAIAPSLFPNPVVSNLKVTLGETQFNSFVVFNLSGQVMMSDVIDVNSSELNLDMGDYTSGVYMIKLENDTEAKMLRIIKE